MKVGQDPFSLKIEGLLQKEEEGQPFARMYVCRRVFKVG